MKDNIKKFTSVFILLIAFFFISSCNSVSSVHFRRYYSPIDGSCSENIIYNGITFENNYVQTNLAKLFTKFPDAKAPQGTVQSGAYFYFVRDEDSGFGSSTGDYAERAAFLLYDMEKVYAKDMALKIRECLITDDAEKMHDLYKEIALKSEIREEFFVPDKKNKQELSYLREYKTGSSGKKVSHGLTRIFYENGMIKKDIFYRNGKQEGIAHEYNSDCMTIH